MGVKGYKVAKQSFAGKERSQAGAWEREKPVIMINTQVNISK
jgi:hypothetical protein